jgi:hypothetical protein|tara:strand:- start:1411 stop:1842 length:432 start_codon:yes stop_codon:yes gene_type:complete
MDKFTQIASKILNEYGNVMGSSIPEDQEDNPLFKKLYLEDPKFKVIYDKIRFGKLDTIGEKEKDYYFDALNKAYSSMKNNIEDQEALLTKDDQDALKVATKLSTGVEGGINPFNNPQKKINKTLGKMYNKIAKKIDAIAKKVD